MNLRTINVISCTFCLTAATAFGQDASVTNAAPTSPPWDISASAGLTLTRGNSKTLLGTANLLGSKKWDEGKNELDLGVEGVYGENNSVRNAESVQGFGQYNRLFTDRFFGYLRLEGLHDAIADVDYRLMVSPGVGYYLIKETNTTLRAEFGPGYIYERDADDSTHSYMILRLAERFDQKLNDHVKIWEGVEILPQVDKFSNYILNAELGVESGMTKHLALQTYVQDTYHSEPAAGRVKNDVKLVAGVKYKF
jgi:putative salt-induced outer membrane protein YdiY